MPVTSLILMALFFVGINIPCFVIAWLGSRFIEKLGRYPSQTPAIQTGVVLQLVIVEVATFTFILALFKILSPEQAG